MYKVYSMLCYDLSNGKIYNGHNLAFQIKSKIDDLAFSDIWLNQNVYNINIYVLKERLLSSTNKPGIMMS